MGRQRTRWGEGAPNGFQWKINFGQKSLVSIKSACIIKVWAAGNRYKLHLSLRPWAPCLIKRMGFPLCGLGKGGEIRPVEEKGGGTIERRESSEKESCPVLSTHKRRMRSIESSEYSV